MNSHQRKRAGQPRESLGVHQEATPDDERPEQASPPSPEEIAHKRRVYLRSIPESQQAIYQRAYARKGLPNAIRAKCLDCCCGSRAEAAGCPCVECPLWERNPYRKVAK